VETSAAISFQHVRGNGTQLLSAITLGGGFES